MAKKSAPDALRAALLERELVDAVRRRSFEDIEKIPEMRDLIQRIATDKKERALLAESIGTLPHENIQKMFDEYMEERFDAQMHSFFGKLYEGIMQVFRVTMSARMEVLEEAMADMKRSVLMAAVHPYGWVEGVLVSAVIEFIGMQPGAKATLHSIYRHVAFDARIPLPGTTLVDKYQYILRVLRGVENLREIEGFVFEITDFKVLEEHETLATTDGYREAAAASVIMRKMEEEA